MELTSHTLSIGGISTFCFIKELGLLFEAGDGAAMMIRKEDVDKINHIVLSDIAPEFTGGLVSLVKRIMVGLTIHYPKKYENTIAKFKEELRQFSVDWNPLEVGSLVSIKGDINLTVLKSFRWGQETIAFTLDERRTKIKPEYMGLTPSQLVEIKKCGNDVSYPVYVNAFVYSLGIVEEGFLKGCALWITGDQFNILTKQKLSKNAEVRQIMFILLERDEWFKSFHFEKWEDINTLDYVPVPAVPLLHKFSWIF